MEKSGVEASREVLVLAPSGHDAPLAISILERDGIQARSCDTLEGVAQQLRDQTDAVLITQEAIDATDLQVFLDAVAAQPPWSDLPLIILTSASGSEEVGATTLRIFGPRANITLLERPLGALTLVSAVRGAVRARNRQREVRDLLNRQETILGSISDAFSAIDRDWRYTFVNQHVAEWARLPMTELIGRVIWDVFPELKGTEFQDRCYRAMKKRLPQHFEHFHEVWDHWFDTRIYPTEDGIVIFRADVTARRLQEEQIRESDRLLRILEERARLAIDAADIGTFDFFPATGKLEFSRRAKQLFGLATDAVVTYDTYVHGVHPDDRHIVRETVERVNRPGADSHFDIEYRTVGHDDGRERWVAEKGSALRDESGAIVRFIGTMLDITERKRGEEVLRASEEQLRFVTDHASPIMIAQCDVEERFLFVNAPYATRFGRQPSEIIGRRIVEVVGSAAYAALEPYITRVVAGERLQFETEVPYEAGTPWMLVNYIPGCDALGNVTSFLAVIQDVSERKAGELALEKAKRAAEEANRAKDQFLAMLSHELRTPLTPVMMTVASLLRDPKLDESLRAEFEVLQRNIELEALLIDDLLDLTRIAHGKLEMHADAIDIHAALEHALTITATELEKKNLSVTRSFGAAEHHCWADGARLQQVFWNIIKNAVKFTPARGQVVVRTRNDNARNIVIEITDTGVGIAPELQPRIFDAFEQGGPGVTSRFGGLGLGLAISRRVVDMHQGEISVFSEGIDRGATFTVTLKAMETSLLDDHRVPFGQPAQRNGSPGKILLVEDHADTARILHRLLENAGYTVHLAGSVAEARQLAGAAEIDLIISDLGLPDGSGLDLMRELSRTRDVPGIALSGFGMDDDVAACRAAGFAEHLTKPVDWDRLRDAIERVSASAPGSVASPSH